MAVLFAKFIAAAAGEIKTGLSWKERKPVAVGEMQPLGLDQGVTVEKRREKWPSQEAQDTPVGPEE